MENINAFGKASYRAENTIESNIKQVTQWMKPDIQSMSQGMVHYTVPQQVIDSTFSNLQTNVQIHKYGPIEGHPELLSLLKKKVETRNKLTNREIMLSSGANQGFFSVVLALCDPGDEVILLAPFFFNHKMALQLCNVTPVVVRCKEDLSVDLEAIKKAITSKTKMVVLVTPSNPSGHVESKESIQQLQKLCLESNIWLISDEAYEYFVYEDNMTHYSADGPNVINLYSFSKGHGMPGWRVGYLAYPPHLKSALDKVQDTVPINVCQFSQQLAISALKFGDEWIHDRVKALKQQRELVWDAVKDCPGTIKTSGALYFLIKLPEGVNELKAVEFLATQWKVLLIPCSEESCGLKGYIRVSYANLTLDAIKEAASKLKEGLKQIRENHKTLNLT